ncbi:MAG: electron transfer flavoprotein alpha subunit apoprotein [Actinomycetota bacterium]
MTLRIATLVKQIPALEEMRIGPDGRLDRSNCALEMNPYCRRAVSASVEAVREHGGSVTVITLGPPGAVDVLREAIAWGMQRGVEISGVHICGPEFAGSDTLATARALVASMDTVLRSNASANGATRSAMAFDIVIAGKNSVDSDTGQVPPAVAELLDLPLLAGVRWWSIENDELHAHLEHGDSLVEVVVELPAFITTAERLLEPAKVDPVGRAEVPEHLITELNASQIGAGPWGDAGSLTWVGEPMAIDLTRTGEKNPDAPLESQVLRALEVLLQSNALSDEASIQEPQTVSGPVALDGPSIAVLVEPGLEAQCRNLIAKAANLADQIDGYCTAITFDGTPFGLGQALGRWGVGQSIEVSNALVEEDAAAAVIAWAIDARPWAILALSTSWGREVGARAAAALNAGMIGDAVSLAVSDEGRLIATKSALGGAFVVPIGCRSDIQIATVRAGLLPSASPRALFSPPRSVHIGVAARHRMKILSHSRDDSIDLLATSHRIVGIGRGVDPDEYPQLDALTSLLGAPIGATRKVTDAGWQPRGRQIGITGISVTPRLFISIGAQGKLNHSVGFRGAGTVLAINSDPDAAIFDYADIGIVGDWRVVLPLLVKALTPHVSSD